MGFRVWVVSRVQSFLPRLFALSGSKLDGSRGSKIGPHQHSLTQEAPVQFNDSHAGETDKQKPKATVFVCVCCVSSQCFGVCRLWA